MTEIISAFASLTTLFGTFVTLAVTVGLFFVGRRWLRSLDGDGPRFHDDHWAEYAEYEERIRRNQQPKAAAFGADGRRHVFRRNRHHSKRGIF